MIFLLCFDLAGRLDQRLKKPRIFTADGVVVFHGVFSCGVGLRKRIDDG
jgi:hypothetical protein